MQASYEVPWIKDDEYYRGNVLWRRCGEHVSIEKSDADLLAVGRRGQRSGLLYDSSMPGFEVETWPFVCHAGADGRFLLQGEGAAAGVGGALLVDVQRRFETDPRLLGIASDMVAVHSGKVREADISQGCMVGAGMHQSRDGFVREFAVLKNGKGREQAHRKVVERGLEMAGRAFNLAFLGRGVGYEEMLQHQDATFGHRSKPWPMCWSATRDLGNSMHVDVGDGARSYAAWFSRTGKSIGWWLLFPRHGLAVQLTHGTFISWDGRVQPHCTSVATVAPGDGLYSLFCSLPKNAAKTLQLANKCRALLITRSAPPVTPELKQAGVLSLLRRLAVGVPVLLRRTLPLPRSKKGCSKKSLIAWGKKHARWVSATVLQVTEAGVTIRENKSKGRSLHNLSLSAINNCLVLVNDLEVD